MGRDKKNKPRTMRDWRDEVTEAQAGTVIHINSAVRNASDQHEGVLTCYLKWDAHEWYAPTWAVMQTARDLMAAATMADMIGKLLALGLDGDSVNGLTMDLGHSYLGGRQPVWGGMLGTPDTIGCMPAGSSKLKRGLVILRRGDRNGAVAPDGARDMAAKWMECALHVESDELFLTALTDMFGENHRRVEALMSYVSAMRGLTLDNREKFRVDEAERLRLHMESGA